MKIENLARGIIAGTTYFIFETKKIIMSHLKRSKLEKIAKRITPMKVSNDEKGNYLHYCKYGQHYGVIGSIKAQDCIDKKCNHYKRYREE